jgi:hypothetical protein
LFTATKQLENACEQYVFTREQWLRNVHDKIVTEQYNHATDYLFAAFAFYWSADEKFLPEAFSQFRKAVVRWGDGGAA